MVYGRNRRVYSVERLETEYMLFDLDDIYFKNNFYKFKNIPIHPCKRLLGERCYILSTFVNAGNIKPVVPGLLSALK